MSYLEDMAPILALVVHTLVQNLHDLEELVSIGLIKAERYQQRPVST